MSPERDELLRLVQEIPDEDVPAVPADVRRRLQPVASSSWPPAWFGIAEGDGTVTAAGSEDLLADGFGR